MKLKKVVIIGMGIIGGSIGKALLEKGIADEVAGVCRRQSSLDRAIKMDVLTTGYVNNYPEATAGADMIFIATPVPVIKDVLRDLAEVLDGGVIVADVGSAKKEIVELAEGFGDRFSFVGGHPLAGSEKSGVEHAKGDLFHGSLCVLTRGRSTIEEDLLKVKELWNDMGAETEVLSPEEHDEIIAFTSHLPHAVAYSLAGVQREEYEKFMATGFEDTSRIASADPVLWRGIFMSNRGGVLRAIERFREVLSGIEDAIRRKDGKGLEEKLRRCKEARDGIF